MDLFYKRIIIHSSKSSAEVNAVLSAVTGGSSVSGKNFYGEIEYGKFALHPTTHIFKNTFNPVLYGKITENDRGCDVEIEAKPYARGIIIMCILSLFCIVSIAVCLMGVLSVIRNEVTEESISRLLLIPMLAAVFAVFHFAFSIPAKNALEYLEKLLA